MYSFCINPENGSFYFQVWIILLPYRVLKSLVIDLIVCCHLVYKWLQYIIFHLVTLSNQQELYLLPFHIWLYAELIHTQIRYVIALDFIQLYYIMATLFVCFSTCVNPSLILRCLKVRANCSSSSRSLGSSAWEVTGVTVLMLLSITFSLCFKSTDTISLWTYVSISYVYTGLKILFHLCLKTERGRSSEETPLVLLR